MGSGSNIPTSSRRVSAANAPGSLLPLPVLDGERVGVGRSGPQILRMLMSTASPLTRSQSGQRKSAVGSSRPLPQSAGRGEDHPAPESRLGAGIVTIGGLALRPST